MKRQADLYWRIRYLEKIYPKFRFEWFTTNDFLNYEFGEMKRISNKTYNINRDKQENECRIRLLRLHIQGFLNRQKKDNIFYYQLNKKKFEKDFDKLKKSCERRAKGVEIPIIIEHEEVQRNVERTIREKRYG